MRVGRDVVTGSGLVRPRRRAAAGGFEEVHPFGLAVPGFGQVQGDVAAAVACGPRRDVECAQQRVFDRLLGVSTNGVVYTNGSAFVVGGNNCAYGGCQWLSVAVSGCGVPSRIFLHDLPRPSWILVQERGSPCSLPGV